MQHESMWTSSYSTGTPKGRSSKDTVTWLYLMSHLARFQSTYFIKRLVVLVLNLIRTKHSGTCYLIPPLGSIPYNKIPRKGKYPTLHVIKYATVEPLDGVLTCAKTQKKKFGAAQRKKLLTCHPKLGRFRAPAPG